MSDVSLRLSGDHQDLQCRHARRRSMCCAGVDATLDQVARLWRWWHRPGAGKIHAPAHCGSAGHAGCRDSRDRGGRIYHGARRTACVPWCGGIEVGFVYQFHHLLPEFSAQENIVLPQLAAGVARRTMRTRSARWSCLRLSGIATAGASPSGRALSGGEQQRVAFCRALANQAFRSIGG